MITTLLVTGVILLAAILGLAFILVITSNGEKRVYHRPPAEGDPPSARIRSESQDIEKFVSCPKCQSTIIRKSNLSKCPHCGYESITAKITHYGGLPNGELDFVPHTDWGENWPEDRDD